MKTTLLTGAALALVAAVAAPASAQVSGIGVADPAIVVAGSKALNGAYTQIGTTFSAQNTQLQQLAQQRQTILKKFDTNNDGVLDANEQKAAQNENDPNRKQLASVEDQINKVRAPMDLAAAYAVQQIAQQLSPAVQQVVSQNNVQLILPSDGVLFRANAADLNEKIVNALDQRVPQVSITPPAGWQPDQGTIQLFNQVQQVRAEAAAAQAQQRQAGAAATPTPAPAQRPAPTGRAAPTRGR